MEAFAVFVTTAYTCVDRPTPPPPHQLPAPPAPTALALKIDIPFFSANTSRPSVPSSFLGSGMKACGETVHVRLAWLGSAKKSLLSLSARLQRRGALRFACVFERVRF